MKLFLQLILVFQSIVLFSQQSNESLIKNPTKLKEYVTDETGTLSNAQLEYLRMKLYNLFDTTSTQIVVYMIKTLNGESIEEVSYAIATANKIGQKDFNNGVLLLIAKNDKKLRIEVGYGLEGVLTDALCVQIIKNEITPQFKNNNFYLGISKGIDAIALAVRGEYKKSDLNKNKRPSAVKTSSTLIFALVGSILLIIFVFWIIALFSSKTRYVGGKISSSTSYSSHSSSSYSSSSHSSSSSSHSSFSGGGGSFGGGGASGSW